MVVAVCVIFSVGVRADEIYLIPGISIEPQDSSACPQDNQTQAVRAGLKQKVSTILANKFNNYTIPECGGSGWRRAGFLDMTDPASPALNHGDCLNKTLSECVADSQAPELAVTLLCLVQMNTNTQKCVVESLATSMQALMVCMHHNMHKTSTAHTLMESASHTVPHISTSGSSMLECESFCLDAVAHSLGFELCRK